MQGLYLGLLLASLAYGPGGALAQQDESSPSDRRTLRGEVTQLRQEYQTRLCGCEVPCDGCPAQSGGCGDGCGCGTCGCFEPCCHPSGLWASAELMFFRYHRADGTREGVLANEFNEFDFETTPRITVGWVNCDGLGVRARYWEFDHNAPVAGPDPLVIDREPASLCVDTYTLDFEVFDTFCLNRNWDLELAAGIRYNEFLEVMSDDEGDNVIEDRLNSFSGFGIVVSAEVRRLVGCNGAVFARARASILMDDKDIFNDSGTQQVRLRDVTVGTTELAFGYDYVVPMCDGAYAFLRLQAEWQNWYNYSSGFEDTANTEDFAGPADVGFGGFGVGIGIVR
jgi:hypothetical protein